MVIRIGSTSSGSEGAPNGAPFAGPEALVAQPEAQEFFADPRQAFYEDWQRWSCQVAPLEEQKQRYTAAIAAELAAADEGLAPKLKLAASMYEWVLFCEPRETLPTGLVYRQERLRNEVAFGSKQANWAFNDAMDVLSQNQEVIALRDMRSGYEFDSSAKQAVIEMSPEYADLVSIVS